MPNFRQIVGARGRWHSNSTLSNRQSFRRDAEQFGMRDTDIETYMCAKFQPNRRGWIESESASVYEYEHDMHFAA